MIKLWGSGAAVADEDEFLALVEEVAQARSTPFSAEIVKAVGQISTEILRNPITRAAPQFVALGYWMRTASVKRLADAEIESTPRDQVLAPRGLALHLPPMNVDTIFVYSWVLSLLAGNSNVVRMPLEISDATEVLIRTITRVLDSVKIGSRHLFCSYPYGGELESRLSQLVDLRIIWGGDAKVDAVSRVPIRPDGLSIGFPDRQSLALLSLDAYAQSSPAARDDLAVRLFNDAYWFDQMGCSSPRLLAWVGSEGEFESPSRDLYDRLQSVIAGKNYRVEPAVAVTKLVMTNDLLVEGLASHGERYSNELQVVQVVDPPAAMQKGIGGGFFAECRLEKLDDAAALANRKLQTITYFGFDSAELRPLAQQIAGHGGFRIVPIGQALDFDAVWDGVPLLSLMTRRVVIRS